MVYSTDRSKAVVPVSYPLLLCVLFCFFPPGDLFYVLSCVSCVVLFLCSLSIAIASLREEKKLILVLFVRLFDLRLFGFLCFLFLLVSGKGCGLLLWHSLDFPRTFFDWLVWFWSKVVRFGTLDVIRKERKACKSA